MEIVLVDSEDKLIELVSTLDVAQCISVDTELTCLHPMAPDFKVVGMSLAVSPNVGYYIPLFHKRKVGLLFDLDNYRPNDTIKQLPAELVIRALKPILETREIMGHGLKIDYQALKRCLGIELKHIVYDSLIASHILDERGKHGLKRLTEIHLGYRPTSFDDVIEGVSDSKGTAKKAKRLSPSKFEYVHPEDAAAYAAPDAVNPIRLRDKFRAEFLKSPELIQVLTIEVRDIPIIAEMEMVGSYLDKAYLKDMHLKLEAELEKLRARLCELAKKPDLNPASDPQMVQLLYTDMGLPEPKKRRKGDTSNEGMLDKTAVEKLEVQLRTSDQAHYKSWRKDQALELVDVYHKWNQFEKLDGAYTTSLINLAIGPKLYTVFNQNGTRSGRLSSEAPNFQNMPRGTDPTDPRYGYDIRRAFLANEPGKPTDFVFVLADYSSMEMRIAAALSGCPQLSGILTGKQRDAKGGLIDIHLWTACSAFGMDYEESVAILKDEKHPKRATLKERRQSAKTVNFGILYGQTKFGLAATLKQSVDFSETVIAGFMKAYPGVAQWMKDTEVFLRRHMFTRTYLGRRRRISHFELREQKAFGMAYRACLNHQVQGTGADIVKIALHKVATKLTEHRLQAQLVSQVHDELIVRCLRDQHELVGKVMAEQMTVELNGILMPVEVEAKLTQSKLEKPLWKLVA